MPTALVSCRSLFHWRAYSQGAGRTADEVKLDCGKDTKWLLFDPNELRRLTHQKGGIMKKIIVTLACLLVAQLAFGQPNSTDKRQTTTEPVTVTGTIITTIEQGATAVYQPSKTLVVNKDTPGRYVLDGAGHVLNKNGEVIRTAIKPGARVRIYYASQGSLRTVDHVVVD
jgi:hypothetical protein